MANDKDFLLKNAVEVSGPTKTTIGTVTSDDIDLSTGNYFTDTPTGVSTYTFSNPADVQAFQLEVTGGTAEVAQNFSTTLYTGTEAVQTITNGLDLGTDGGLVWVKDRVNSITHGLFDTERGIYKVLDTASNAVEETHIDSLTAFNSDGFTLGSRSDYNGSSRSYVSWAFKNSGGFFDVISYTGDGTSGRVINHSLNSDVGFIIIKKRNSTSSGDWYTWHRSITDNYMTLNNTAAKISYANWLNPTSTTFTLQADGSNTNGDEYVAYLFAHDTAADGLIQCGSYTGGSSSVDVNLGWSPSWLLIKRSDGVEDWSIVDNVRGMGTDPLLTGLKALTPNTSSVEESPVYSPIVPSSTGFTAHTGYDARYAANGGNYIYIAIRAASDLDITWPISVEWPGGAAPSAPATGETDLYTFVTDDSGTSYTGIKSADNLS
jgi:hypothetical protein